MTKIGNFGVIISADDNGDVTYTLMWLPGYTDYEMHTLSKQQVADIFNDKPVDIDLDYTFLANLKRIGILGLMKGEINESFSQAVRTAVKQFFANAIPTE